MMSREEQLQGSRSALSYSPSRGSPARPRLYGGVGSLQRQQQQRSISSGKKPPEPLRRAVDDCLSSSSQNVHGNPSAVSSEAARTLRDYIASPSTIDLAYSVLIDHAIAERERSPAVVSRCVALLKRYLLRYVPKVETLWKIDSFCTSSIVECDPLPNTRMPSLTKSSSNLSGGSAISGSISPYPLPAHNFASPSLVKSLNYVRSLVARHIPRLSFQQVPPTGPSNVGKQSLQTLSTLLRRSFNSHLSPESVHNQESPERKEVLCPSSLNLSNLETVDVGSSNNKYIYDDLLKWRWSGIKEQQSSSLMTERDSNIRPQDAQIHGFLEVGAAALLLGDSKSKGESHKYSDKRSIPDANELLQPSTITTANDFTLSHNHLRTITASKRMKQDPQQFWLNVPVSTFNPRARTLFQYRYYSEQQPLRLNPAEISDVIAAVCSESSSPVVNPMATSSLLSNHSGKPSADIAVSVLIKLIIDMYVMDSGSAAPLTLSMLEDMLLCQRVVSRVRVFDILLNLGVHAHLLEPMLPEDPSSIGEDEASIEHQFNNVRQSTLKRRDSDSGTQQHLSAIDNFESWLLVILFEVLLLLVQMEEREEIVWASALSCLFYFVCDRGKIQRSRLEGLDIRVIKALLEISREYAWAQVVRSQLICMLTNMFYRFSDIPTFLVERVDLIGGIEFICLEYSHANSREEKRDLFLVLFDYCLHQINGTCLATGISAYSLDEIQPLATMLVLAEAPEAFYIAVKHGVEGIGEILKRSIVAALSRPSSYERLSSLLEKVTRKLDGIISSFTRLDSEFTYMIWITKAYKTLKSIEVGQPESDDSAKAKLSWATLHALLHSERDAYRHHGYIWLVELLLSEISEEGNKNIWLNVRNFQRQMGIASSQEVSFSTASLPVCILCGLLKSNHNNIRWGFLFVLEKLLIRCKLLLDENEASSHNSRESNLEKANVVIDIMSSALALVLQINETDRVNILKMCDILFSQLCLKLLPAHTVPTGNLKTKMGMGNVDVDVRQHEKSSWNDNFLEDSDTICGLEQAPLFLDTASMAALLLRGCAVVPMPLITRVPVSLLYWPLFQLAGAATDDIALGVAVGSEGRGNLAGAASDIRAALLLLLIGKCTTDRAAFSDVGGVEFFRRLLEDMDSRVAYYSSVFLLKRMMTEELDKYQSMLQSLIAKAQQSNNEKLLENPYLQMCGIIQLSSDLGNQL